MNEHDARQVLLVRTLESAPRTAQWTDDDRDWASREAARIEGEHGDSPSFIARRADKAVERLKTRVPTIERMLNAITWRAWVVPAFMLGAFLLGLLLDAVAADRRINILAPPLLALLLWNLLVYLAMAINAVRSRARADSRRSRPGLIARGFSRLAGLAGTRVPKQIGVDGGPLGEFVSRWATLSAPLTAARSSSGLHLSAAAFAAGALAGLYFRGLAFEYLAGWESTFLAAGGAWAIAAQPNQAKVTAMIVLPDDLHRASSAVDGDLNRSHTVSTFDQVALFYHADQA